MYVFTARRTIIKLEANGVDLNRNFDACWEDSSNLYGLSTEESMCATYKGPFAESEPETRAIADFIKLIKPKCVFSYHWMCSVSADHLLSAKVAINDKDFGKKLSVISKVYSDAYRSAINFKKKKDQYFHYECTSGSLIHWLYLKGIPAFDMEMANDLRETIFENNQYDETTREMLDVSIKGHTEGIIKILEYVDH